MSVDGTDSLDHADLSALKAILPDEMTHGRPSSSQPVPRSDSPLLQKLKQGEVPYAYRMVIRLLARRCSKLEEADYFSAHHVDRTVCRPPSVFRTIMGKECSWCVFLNSQAHLDHRWGTKSILLRVRY